ncbi:MAG: ATP-binding cassette domain-containing protein [Synergistaceae bacterium]|jgi:oligopeptide/dipeptide ABC transporter ATP-binding protein|nr:ATP-binding cassette domain-containing protein [Synergistaceae bacterium]
MGALVEVRRLKKYFETASGMLHAVDGVDFAIDGGRTLGVVGESGCGKSTLGRTILRLTEPTDGEVLYDGEDITRFSVPQMNAIRRDLQLIFQDPLSSLNPRMTVFEIIAEPLKVFRVTSGRDEMDDRVASLMKTVGLADRFSNSYPHELDGGRRQRIGIARALASNPRFIVCDEPVSALDVSIQAQILNLLMDLQEERGISYMFITHNLSVVKHISQEIMVMYLGQCIEKAPSEELFANPLHPYTRALLAAIPVPSLEARKKRKGAIKGEVSNPVDPKPGCRFAPRCSLVSGECAAEGVALRETCAGHFVACVKTGRAHE